MTHSLAYVILINACLGTAAILLHFEILSHLTSWIPRIPCSPRIRILIGLGSRSLCLPVAREVGGRHPGIVRTANGANDRVEDTLLELTEVPGLEQPHDFEERRV